MSAACIDFSSFSYWDPQKFAESFFVHSQQSTKVEAEDPSDYKSKLEGSGQPMERGLTAIELEPRTSWLYELLVNGGNMKCTVRLPFWWTPNSKLLLNISEVNDSSSLLKTNADKLKLNLVVTGFVLRRYLQSGQWRSTVSMESGIWKAWSVTGYTSTHCCHESL